MYACDMGATLPRQQACVASGRLEDAHMRVTSELACVCTRYGGSVLMPLVVLLLLVVLRGAGCVDELRARGAVNAAAAGTTPPAQITVNC